MPCSNRKIENRFLSFSEHLFKSSVFEKCSVCSIVSLYNITYIIVSAVVLILCRSCINPLQCVIQSLNFNVLVVDIVPIFSVRFNSLIPIMFKILV